MPNERERAGWQVYSSEVVIDSPHLRLRRDDIVLPSGGRIEGYYVRESRGFAVIFALTEERNVVLVSQYKHGIGRRLLELPAGALDPGETPLECAKRELLEETGYASESAFEHAATFATDPTNSDAQLYLFVARDVRQVQLQDLDVSEDIEVRLASLDDVRRYVRDGTIEVGSQLASIYFILDRMGRL